MMVLHQSPSPRRLPILDLNPELDRPKEFPLAIPPFVCLKPEAARDVPPETNFPPLGRTFARVNFVAF
jgi:hypothetical protein